MRTLTATEAASQIRDRDSLGIPLGPGQPGSLLHALGERESYVDLRVFGALLVDFYPLFTKPGVKLLSGFFGPIERALAGAGHDVEFVPADFRRFATIVQRLSPRVMATNVAAPSRDGRFSLSLHAGATVEEIRRAGADPKRLLIAELNPALPHTLGMPPEHTHALDPDEIDILVESDRDPFLLPDAEASDVERAIAEHARRFIEDGATLQSGIGGIPNTVMGILANSTGGDYGVHSEMFTTGLMRLHEAGKVSNRKGYLDGFSICTFAAGTRALYDWLDGNDLIRFLPVEQVNEPGLIARNRHVVSINGALSVDLFGQIAADTLSGAQFSGIGGHEDFMAGAAFSSHGRSLICLPATARAGDRLVSRIVTALSDDTLVTTPRHQADVVITEYGAAELSGRTVGERARALAHIAHPAMRDALLQGEGQTPSIAVESSAEGVPA